MKHTLEQQIKNLAWNDYAISEVTKQSIDTNKNMGKVPVDIVRRVIVSCANIISEMLRCDDLCHHAFRAQINLGTEIASIGGVPTSCVEVLARRDNNRFGFLITNIVPIEALDE